MKRFLLLLFILGLVPMTTLGQERPDAGRISGRQRGTFTVGHTIRRLNVPGTLGENRPINVHLWYPARRLNDCDNSGNSNGNRGDHDQGCSVTPSVYTSRLNGIPLLPQWTAVLDHWHE